MSGWRLILHGPGDGAWNMAVDRAMLDAYERGVMGPTLRLYGWQLPTASLGRFQALSDVSEEACASYGVSVCRRPTGGRGVLHDDEVTYSIVSGVRDGLPRGTAASYRVLCGALVEAYRGLGVEASLTARERGSAGSAACYLHATSADLSLGAAKLSGSAQVWSGQACLQHGSFVISRNIPREADVFGLDEQGRDSLSSATSTIQEALGHRPDRGRIVEAIVRGVERGLGASLALESLSPGETEQAVASIAEYSIAW